MTSNEERLLPEIIRRIARVANPGKIILFGSYATGQPGPDSDLDLVVVQQTALSPPQRLAPIRRALRGLKVAVDILVYTPEEVDRWKGVPTAFITTVMNKGKVVYG